MLWSHDDIIPQEYRKICQSKTVLQSHLFPHTIILIEGLVTFLSKVQDSKYIYPGLKGFGESQKQRQGNKYDMMHWTFFWRPGLEPWFCHELCDEKWHQIPESPFIYMTNKRIVDGLMPTWAIYVEIYHHSFLSLPLRNWVMSFWHIEAYSPIYLCYQR